MVKIWQFVNFEAGNSCHWVRSMKRKYRNLPLSHDIILKLNYTVIFISLSLVNICQNYIGLYLSVSRSSVHCYQEGNIKSWTGQPSSPSCPYIKVGRKEGAETMRIAYKFRSSLLEVLYKKYLFRKVWKVFTETPVMGSCFNKIARLVTVLK